MYKDISGTTFTAKMIDTDFLIFSLYGPTRDDPEFYVELEERINEVGYRETDQNRK